MTVKMKTKKKMERHSFQKTFKWCKRLKRRTVRSIFLGRNSLHGSASLGTVNIAVVVNLDVVFIADVVAIVFVIVVAVVVIVYYVRF